MKVFEKKWHLFLYGASICFCGAGMVGVAVEPLSKWPDNALRICLGMLMAFSGYLGRHLAIALSELPEDNLFRIKMLNKNIRNDRMIAGSFVLLIVFLFIVLSRLFLFDS